MSSQLIVKVEIEKERNCKSVQGGQANRFFKTVRD